MKDILLFFKEYEADKYLPGDRYLKRILKPLYNRLHHRQKVTGFGVSFELLAQALRDAGYTVRVNDYSFARANPDYPVGIVGFPVILDNWTLPNPAILGPSLYDHPGIAPELFNDMRFRKYVVLGDWTYDLYASAYGDRCVKWFAGINTNKWFDASGEQKNLDFLVYDKVRWNHDHYQNTLIDSVRRELDQRCLTYRLIRYKFHDHETYRDTLKESRGMIFLCEHETQGLAYQEAMAMNVPILAWDRGYWADPLWEKFEEKAPAASSVPFFDERCGTKFRDIESFPDALSEFQGNIGQYEPRQYVMENLSMKASAQIYAHAYFELAKR